MKDSASYGLRREGVETSLWERPYPYVQLPWLQASFEVIHAVWLVRDRYPGAPWERQAKIPKIFEQTRIDDEHDVFGTSRRT
jgi:hypothetical protein